MSFEMHRPQKAVLSARPASGAEDVVLTVSSELTESFEYARPVDADERLRVVQDSTGAPMMVSIGSDDALYMTLRGVGATGWRQLRLSDAFGAEARVSAFAFGQDRRGRITLAAAVDEGAESRLYVAINLPNATEDAVWETHEGIAWGDRGTRPATTITSLVIDQADGRPLIVAGASDPNEGANLYWIGHRPEPFAEALKVGLQFDADAIIDMAVGQTVAHGAGVFCLHRLKSKLHLTFTARTEFGVAGYQDLPLPRGAASPAVMRWIRSGKKLGALSVVPDEDGNSEVYLGLGGLFVYSVDEIVRNAPAKAQTIASSRAVPAIQGIQARSDLRLGGDARTVLWAVDQGGTLHETHRVLRRKSWSTPIAIRQGVAQIGAIRDQSQRANALFIVGDDRTVTHIWQDPDSRVWASAAIETKDPERIESFRAWVTRLRLVSPEGAPIQDRAVLLSASDWCYLNVNGRATVLRPGADHRVSVTPETDGAITLVNRDQSLAPPVYRLSADWLDDAAEVNPAAWVLGRLAATSVEDLLGAKLGEGTPGGEPGEPLLSPDFRDAGRRDEVDAVANGMRMLARTAQSDGERASLLRHLGPEEAAVPMSAELTSPFEEPSLGIEFTDTGLVSAPPDDLPQGGFLSDVGDFLEGLVSGALKAAKVVFKVVKGGLRFVCKVAGKVWSFVVSAARQVGKALAWICDKIGMVWDKFTDWLGALVGWSDILKWRTVIAEMADNGLQALEAFGPAAKAQVGEIFDHMDKVLADLRTFDEVEPPSPSADKDDEDGEGGMKAFAEGILDYLMNNPVSTFLFDKIIKPLLSFIVTLEPPEDADEAQAAVDGAGEPRPLSALSGIWDQLRADAVAAFADLEIEVGLLTDGELPKRILEFLANAGLTALRALLGVVRRLVEALLDGILALIRGFRVVMTTRISSPLLNFVANLFGRGQKEAPSTSILELVSLVIAVPTSLLNRAYKAVKPEDVDFKGQNTAALLGSSQTPRTTNSNETRDDPVVNAVIMFSTVPNMIAIGTSVCAHMLNHMDATKEVAKPVDNPSGKDDSDLVGTLSQLCDVIQIICLLMSVAGSLSSPEARTRWFANLGVMLAVLSFSIDLSSTGPKTVVDKSNKALLFLTLGYVLSLVRFFSGDGASIGGDEAQRKRRIAEVMMFAQSWMQTMGGLSWNSARKPTVDPITKSTLFGFGHAGAIGTIVLSIVRLGISLNQDEQAPVLFGMPPDW